MTRAAVLALVLIAVGLIGGALFVPRPARPAEVRAGYRVLQAELHAHTRLSDGTLSPCDLVLLARQRGLDVIAVTEHNAVGAARVAEACASLFEDAPLVLPASEITTRELHVLAIGVRQNVDARAGVGEIVRQIQAQGGLAIVAHPTRRYHAAAERVCAELDGVEIVHPIAYARERPIGSYADIVAFGERPCLAGAAKIGTSDYHGGSILGLLRTYVFVESASEEGVLAAIRAGRAVTYAPDGRAFGPPELVRALEEQPLAPRPTDYDYRPVSSNDRMTRLAGLAGMLLLLFAGRRARRAADRGVARPPEAE